MRLNNDDFNHLVDLYNRRNNADVIGVPHQEHIALGRAIDILRSDQLLIVALDELQSAETAYRMTYDLDGYHHQNTLDARGKLRTAGYRARDVLVAVSEPGKSNG